MIGLDGLEELAPEEHPEELAVRLRLYYRAHDYDDVIPYVKHIVKEGHPDGFWPVLERVMDDLDRGMSDTMEEFAGWKRGRRKARKAAKKRAKLLLEGASCWHEELLDRLDNADMTRSERIAQRRFCAELGTAISESQP